MATVYYPKFGHRDRSSTMGHAAYLFGTTEEKLYSFLLSKNVIFLIPPRRKGEPYMWWLSEEYHHGSLARMDACSYQTDNKKRGMFEYTVWTYKGLLFLDVFLKCEGFYLF